MSAAMGSDKPCSEKPRFRSCATSGSRFVTDGTEVVAWYTTNKVEGDVDIGAILAATDSELTYIGPKCLEFHGNLGSGTSFEVRREVYRKLGQDKRVSYYFRCRQTHEVQQTYERRASQAMRDGHAGDMSADAFTRGRGCIIPTLAYG